MPSPKLSRLELELLAALREMTETYWGIDNDDEGDGISPPPDCIIQARAAIFNAEGR